jgi:hypothetical protein
MHTTLTTITILGLALSFIAGITSQLWKYSVETEGEVTKQLTPAGWLSLGLSLVGLMGSVASELIRVSISNNEQLQAKTEAAQRLVLQEQETRWRNDMTAMLSVAKSEIEKNLEDTIRGFEESQKQIGQTQADIITSKQALIENSLQHTNEIIVAGQPLTSLSLHWEFSSANVMLRREMTKGQDQINKNAEDEQGGVPEIPYDVMEYQAALLPLISYIGAFGDKPKTEGISNPDDGSQGSIAVLMPLDEAQNATLSFGAVGPKATWYEDHEGALISTGFRLSPDTSRRKGNTTPKSTVELAENADQDTSHYSIDWNLDPATLADAIDRRNVLVSPTARLPKRFKIAIFYKAKLLPFQQNNFGVPYADIWNVDESDRDYVTLGPDLDDVTLTIEVNGFRELRYNLSKMYKVKPRDKYDDEVDTGCAMLEFDAT